VKLGLKNFPKPSQIIPIKKAKEQILAQFTPKASELQCQSDRQN
jgi:hypothetical protein